MKLFFKRIFVNFYIWLIFMLFFCSHLFAQPAPIKWGVIPIEDLKMKSFPEDSNAAAIILCDYGKAWFTKNFELVQERHVYIKILSESGYRWASPIIPFYSKDKRQRVEDIMGQTINLTKNGKVKKSRLNKKSIVREKIDNEWERFVKINGNDFTLTDKIILNNSCFKPEEYMGLREFYNYIVAAHAEEIVLESPR